MNRTWEICLDPCRKKNSTIPIKCLYFLKEPRFVWHVSSAEVPYVTLFLRLSLFAIHFSWRCSIDTVSWMLLQAVALVTVPWMPRGLAPGARMLLFIPRAWPTTVYKVSQLPMRRAFFFRLSAPSCLKVMGGGGEKRKKNTRNSFLDTEQSQSLWENKNSETTVCWWVLSTESASPVWK